MSINKHLNLQSEIVELILVKKFVGFQLFVSSIILASSLFDFFAGLKYFRLFRLVLINLNIFYRK